VNFRAPQQLGRLAPHRRSGEKVVHQRARLLLTTTGIPVPPPHRWRPCEEQRTDAGGGGPQRAPRCVLVAVAVWRGKNLVFGSAQRHGGLRAFLIRGFKSKAQRHFGFWSSDRIPGPFGMRVEVKRKERDELEEERGGGWCWAT
jgi:hypothetical protein